MQAFRPARTADLKVRITLKSKTLSADRNGSVRWTDRHVTFLAYVEQVLVLTLRRDEVVVLDTSRSQEPRGSAERLSRMRQFLRVLPPHSPDFNPIEQALAQLKAFFRAVRPRT